MGSLNLFKYGRKERRILELQKKISDMEDLACDDKTRKILELEKKISDMESENREKKKETNHGRYMNTMSTMPPPPYQSLEVPESNHVCNYDTMNEKAYIDLGREVDAKTDELSEPLIT